MGTLLGAQSWKCKVMSATDRHSQGDKSVRAFMVILYEKMLFFRFCFEMYTFL